MASMNRDDGGLVRIAWRDGGRQVTLRLGRMTKQDAETVFLRVRRLIVAKVTGDLDGETARWAAALPDEFHERLVERGLLVARKATVVLTVAQLWDRFFGVKSVKPATALVYKRVRGSMEAHFGGERKIDGIGREGIEGWVKALADEGLAVATRSKMIQVGRQLFGRAVEWGLLERSPFRGIKAGPQTNAKRQAYIPLADLDKILSACPSIDWRLIFALPRLGGVRCPSEIVGLTWGDVDFEARRMTVRSPKTEHHEGGAVRLVPFVPALYDLLLAAHTEAPVGSECVVPRLRFPDTNLRTHAHRIMARAGVEPPPKLFVNLRASCATDWAREHGGHVAAKWCGHSPLIALKHYAQVRPEDFDRATGLSRDNGLTTSGPISAHPEDDSAQPNPDSSIPEGQEASGELCGAGGNGRYRT